MCLTPPLPLTHSTTSVKRVRCRRMRGALTTALDAATRLQRAVEALQTEVESRRAVLGEGHPQVARLLLALAAAQCADIETRPDAAETLVEATVAVERVLRSEVDPDGAVDVGAMPAAVSLEVPVVEDATPRSSSRRPGSIGGNGQGQTCVR